MKKERLTDGAFGTLGAGCKEQPRALVKAGDLALCGIVEVFFALLFASKHSPFIIGHAN